MEQFSLEKYLENQSRKITTRYGDREVRIICTDRKGKCPIVALMVDMDDGSEYITSHSINGWIDDEEKYPDKRDLFFADEEEKLSEFENMLRYVLECYSGHEFASESEIETLKLNAKSLLDLAKKEFQPEFDKEMDKMLAETDKVVYQKGREDALKDLPKWKKATECKEFEVHVCVMDEDMYPYLDTEVYKGEYYIELDDLKTLPKEE